MGSRCVICDEKMGKLVGNTPQPADELLCERCGERSYLDRMTMDPTFIVWSSVAKWFLFGILTGFGVCYATRGWG